MPGLHWDPNSVGPGARHAATEYLRSVGRYLAYPSTSLAWVSRREEERKRGREEMKKDASCRDLRIEAGDHGKDRSRSTCPSGILIADSILGNLAVATESRKSTPTPTPPPWVP